MVRVHENLFFITPLVLLLWSKPFYPKIYIAVSIIFFLQSFIFYGFGRDANYARAISNRLRTIWTINIIAFVNLGQFLYSSKRIYSDIVL